MTYILALDLATRTGWARGRVNELPWSGSVGFGIDANGEKRTDAAVFGAAVDWIMAQFEQGEPLPDLLIIEDMLSPLAMKNATSRAVRDRLAGLHGIMKGMASRYGVGEIAIASVGDVRAHFIGDRSLQRDAAKRAVMERCKMLGWECKDDNAADALAVWSFACATIDPAWGLQVSPLFNRKLRVTV